MTHILTILCAYQNNDWWKVAILVGVIIWGFSGATKGLGGDKYDGTQEHPDVENEKKHIEHLTFKRNSLIMGGQVPRVPSEIQLDIFMEEKNTA